MSLINKELNEFKLNAYQDNKFIEVKKSDLLGKWSVLFFYPADFTFVCPTELLDLENLYEEFKKEGCEIYSVSTDTHFTHKAWHDSSPSISKITYKMVGDPTHTLSKDLDVYIEESGLDERATFIINKEGKVVFYEVVDGNVGRNAEELLRKLQALKFVSDHGDEVCPARWKKGDKTIKPSIEIVGKL